MGNKSEYFTPPWIGNKVFPSILTFSYHLSNLISRPPAALHSLNHGSGSQWGRAVARDQASNTSGSIGGSRNRDTTSSYVSRSPSAHEADRSSRRGGECNSTSHRLPMRQRPRRECRDDGIDPWSPLQPHAGSERSPVASLAFLFRIRRVVGFVGGLRIGVGSRILAELRLVPLATRLDPPQRGRPYSAYQPSR